MSFGNRKGASPWLILSGNDRKSGCCYDYEEKSAKKSTLV
jgi:hypothetical protein